MHIHKLSDVRPMKRIDLITNFRIAVFSVLFIGLTKWYGSHIKGFRYNRVLLARQQRTDDFGKKQKKGGRYL